MNISDMTVGMWAWRRPRYLRRTLASWAQVDGVRDLRSITIALEPSDREADMMAVIDHARDEYGLPLTVRHNPQRLGPQVNPVVSGSHILNEDPDTAFLIAMDEDTLLSDDLLRYMEWAATRFEDDPGVFCVCAHTAENSDADADPEAVHLLPRFRAWVWGTWRDGWFDIAVPTWDRDHSSGNPSGYDWNLDLRVLPQRNLRAAFPPLHGSRTSANSRGVHAHPADFDRFQDPSFREKRGKVEYRLVEAPGE